MANKESKNSIPVGMSTYSKMLYEDLIKIEDKILVIDPKSDLNRISKN
ncbi:hypothetical protein [Neobacillus sp. SuZ13]|nr:hypothetical protein [Neobacillus sp. SuZ13]WHY69746.1 hypothetical protein QNH17_14410 [Neobacillus sp. SuZ13]